MSSWWARIRWADVLVGALVWTLFAGQYVVLDRMFPSSPPGCVETSPFSCWDLRAPLIALLTVPVWYAVWALLLRPCPWYLRWSTPLLVSYAAYRIMQLFQSHVTWVQVGLFVVGYLVSSAAMSALNAAAEAPRRRRS